MITENQLTIAGYRQYVSSGIVHPYSDFFYQKRFSDEVGIKYHVEFLHYPPLNSKLSDTWMAEMVNNEPFMTFQIHRPESIQEVEERMRRFWETQGCKYYALYEKATA